MDSKEDIRRDKYNQWKLDQEMAMRDECEHCSEHNENCFFYDSEEESYDYKSCLELRF